MKAPIHNFKPIKVKGPATLLSDEEYKSLLETLEILSDRQQLSRIESALKNIQKGKVFSHLEVFGHPQPGSSSGSLLTCLFSSSKKRDRKSARDEPQEDSGAHHDKDF